MALNDWSTGYSVQFVQRSGVPPFLTIFLVCSRTCVPAVLILVERLLFLFFQIL